MAQMYHFGTRTLDDASHDIDGYIVTIKERSGSKDPDFMNGMIDFDFCFHGYCQR